MNDKPISNSEDQEAARSHRIYKFRSGFHLLHIQTALVYSLDKFLRRFLSLSQIRYKDYLFTETVKSLMDLTTALREREI